MAFQLKRLGLSSNVEVLIKTNSTTKFFFTDNNLMLDNKLVHGLYVPQGILKTPGNVDIAPANVVNSAMLTLYGNRDQQFNSRFPLNSNGYTLSPAYFGGLLFEIIYFTPKLINIRNSIIEIPNIAGVILPTGGYSIMLTFFYEKYNPAVHQLDDWDELISDEDDTAVEKL